MRPPKSGGTSFEGCAAVLRGVAHSRQNLAVGGLSPVGQPADASRRRPLLAIARTRRLCVGWRFHLQPSITTIGEYGKEALLSVNRCRIWLWASDSSRSLTSVFRRLARWS